MNTVNSLFNKWTQLQDPGKIWKQDVIKCTNLSLTQWAKKEVQTNKLSMVCNILKYSRPTVDLFYLHDFKKEFFYISSCKSKYKS